MKLNNEYNFGIVPTVNMPRSRFMMHKNIRTTFNAGLLIPIYVNPLIQPGDTLKVNSTMVIRMSTPIYPTMDNLFADLRAFFVPHRLVWTHFKEFMGENTTGSWTQTTTFTIPQIQIYTSAGTYSQVHIQKGDSLQYMGVPIGYPKAITTAPTPANCTTEIMALPWRSYALIWSDWYRDENVTPPLFISKGDAATYANRGNPNNNWGTYSNNATSIPLECAPVYKFKDYFNACLPEPQKLAGGPVTLPIGSSAPIKGTGMTLGLTDGTNLGAMAAYSNGTASVTEVSTGGYGQNVGTNRTSVAFGSGKYLGVTTDETKSGLIADLSNAVAATINAQRIAFAVQRIGELSARAGTRYNEIINAFFNVKGQLSAVVQRPQYLGGFRIPLQMQQVPQTSSTNSTSPQGNMAAYSLTVDNQHLLSHSFEEWGTLIFCLCVRQEHSYSQGLANFWSKKNKLDFYWPQLAFLGEQPILTKEIYADGSANDDTVFGYNERWIEYRTEQNINTGAFSPDYAQSLDAWHYGDDLSQAPVLSDAWRRETKDYIDRTLAVQSSVEDQFIMDSRFEFDKTSCMPLRSIPGLMDHF